MAAKKVGELIKEARTNAGLSQTALAAQIEGLTASDIGKAERGEKELSQAALKAIAKATGVTQKSLLEAPKGGAAATTAARKTAGTTAKTSTTTAKKATSAARKASASTAKKSSSASAGELTAAEKTMLNAYRKADAETRKAALKLLKGEQDADILSTLLQSFTGGSGGAGALGGSLLDLLGNLGKK